MPQDLRGAMIIGGHFIANVSPSLAKETFRFPNGAIVNADLPNNPTIIDLRGQKLYVYKRGTGEWRELLEVKAKVDAQVKQREAALRQELERDMKRELEKLTVNLFAEHNIQIEGKEHMVEKPAAPPTKLTEEEQARNDAYFDEDEDEAEDADVDAPEDESHVCGECHKPFASAMALRGHSASHSK